MPQAPWLVKRMVQQWDAEEEAAAGQRRGTIPFPDPDLRPVILTTEGDPICWAWEPPAEGGRPQATDTYAGELGSRVAEAAALLLSWCRNRCTVCGVSHPGIRLFMDHNHDTGLCRGVLCCYCNMLEADGGGGLLFDKYRMRPPAVICGVEVRYDAFAWSVPSVPIGAWELRSWQWEPAPAYFYPLRDGKPWVKNELLLAAREDLTTEQVARLLLRSGPAVAARRKKLFGLDFGMIERRAIEARKARQRRRAIRRRAA